MPETPNLRMTRQRAAILQALCAERTHPTADQVHALVRRRIPRISLATIYRNLELLAEQGRIRKIVVPGGQKRFDATTSDHYHIRCVQCGRVDDVRAQAPSRIRARAVGRRRYRVLGYHLDFWGLCPECAEVSPADGSRATE